MSLSRLVIWGFALLPLLLFVLVFYFRWPPLVNFFTNRVEISYILFTLCTAVFSFLAAPKFSNLTPSAKSSLVMGFKLLLCAYAGSLLLITLIRYSNYTSEVIDVSYYHLAVWQLSEFKIPKIWESTTNLWSQHFEPIIFFLVPVYWLVKDAGILMLIQAGFIISGFIPLYLTGKHLLRSRFLGLCIGAAYLSFGGIQFGYAYGFHPIMFFPPLFFWMYYFLHRQKLFLYYLFLVLALLVKEEISLPIIFWGLYLLIFQKKRLPGVITIALGISWYVFCFYYFIPHFNPRGFIYWGQFPAGQHYSGLLGIIEFALTRPLELAKTFITPSAKIQTFFHSFGFFSFLPLLYPPSWLLVFPSLMVKLLSSDITALNGFHYSAVIGAAVIIAGIESLRRLLVRFPLPVFWGLLILYTAVFANLFYGYHRLSPLLFFRETALTDSQLLSLGQAISLIPPEASVSAHYMIAPHLHKPYEKLRTGPKIPEKSDFVLTDIYLPIVLQDVNDATANLTDLLKNPRYQLIFNQNGALLFKSKTYSP